MSYADLYRKVKKYTRPFLVKQGVAPTQAALVAGKKMEEVRIDELGRSIKYIRSVLAKARLELLAVQEQLKRELSKAIKDLQKSHRSLNETLKKARAVRYTPEAKREIGEAQRSIGEKVAKINKYTTILDQIA